MSQKENPMVNYLGTCPICGKGKIAEGPTIFRCNYAASMDNKCDFHIFKTYNGAEITEKHVKQLISDGKTEVIEFTSQAGKKYKGYLCIDGENVKMEFANNNDNLPKLDVTCPICGEEIIEYSSGYGCKNIHETDGNGEKKCNFWINKNIASRPISKEEAEQLIADGKTGFLDGFVNSNGNEFSCRLVLEEDGNIKFDSTICKCPKCGGDIKIGTKSYNCSNWKEKGCKFTVWREMNYRTITPEEVQQLCENKATDILDGFKTKDKSKTYSGRLIINDDFQVSILR